MLTDLKSLPKSQPTSYYSRHSSLFVWVLTVCLGLSTYLHCQHTDHVPTQSCVHITNKHLASISNTSCFQCSTQHIMLHKIFHSNALVLLTFTVCITGTPLPHKTMKLWEFMWLYRIYTASQNFCPILQVQPNNIFAVLLISFTFSCTIHIDVF